MLFRSRLLDEFEEGDSLRRENIDEEDIENLIIQQIEFCDIILLNKISEVTPEQGAHIRRIIKALQPTAEIIDCDYCDVDFDKLLNTHRFDFDRAATSATWVKEIEKPLDEIEAEHHEHEHEHEHHEHHHQHHHEHDDDDDDEIEEGHVCDEHCHHHHHHHHHDEGEAEEYGIGTFVYYARRPFSLNKFDWLCMKQWPKSIIRCKGVCYFKENPDMSYQIGRAHV